MLARTGRGRFLAKVLGTAMSVFAAIAAIFALIAAINGHGWRGFATLAGVSAAIGAAGANLGRGSYEPSRREALMSVLVLWFTVPLVGTLPFVMDGGMSFVDALFESMSGFTATGATALADFAQFDRTLFAWRSLTQWFGGVGIIVLFIAVFPQLAIAGRSLFFAEAPGPTEERLTPRLQNTASAVLVVYLGLTVVIALAYFLAGLDLYNAVLHAWTTVAAGGFSPEARSFEGFAPAVQWVAVGGMLMAGVNFALQYRVLGGRFRVLFRDPELRVYLLIVAGATAVLTWLLAGTYGAESSLRESAFHVLSILTTTGFAAADFASWNTDAQSVLIALMFVGGSAGSAAGGIKIIRLLIVAKNTSREVRKALHPRAVLPIRVGGRTIPEEVLRSVAAFVTLYVALFGFSTFTLALTGVDFDSAFSASIATLGNIGPGVSALGPMDHYGDLAVLDKLILTFNMYAGRLEVVTLFVIFTGDWWKIPREWRRR